MPPSYRSTQRAPLACTSCATRKIRCSRDIPCRACISRGTAADCRREVVSVRGRLRTADIPASSQSNAELQLENYRLSTLVSSTEAANEPNFLPLDMTEYYEKRLYAAVGRSQGLRTVSSTEDVFAPSKDCSEYFVDSAEVWTAWVHYAFFFPHFRQEHASFWTQGGVMSSQDPLWLAVYFGVLSSTLIFMDDTELSESRPPLQSHDALLRNWYDAAIYFLDAGDFMQRSDIAAVRAIVILGIVATNVGDTTRHTNLWACGIRIAQQLDLGSDRANIGESFVQRESRRRLWWTLVLCEWIPIPARSPCINDIDFDCELPADVDDIELENATDSRLFSRVQAPRPVQYHIMMSKIAILCYQLRAKIRLRRWSVSDVAVFVLQADEQLATLIDQLPPHLQNDEPQTHETRERDRRKPWISYQKTSLAMVILYYRLAINRTLQTQWLEGSADYARARSVCLSSAIGVVNSATSGYDNLSRLRSWAFAMHVFSAAVTLALEIQGSPTPNPQFVEAVRQSQDFLKGVQNQNKLAKEAQSMLDELVIM